MDDTFILGFNELDLGILGIIFLSGVFAAIRGFSWEIISLSSWILTLAAVWYLSWATGPWIGVVMVEYLGWNLPYFVGVGIAGILIFFGMTLVLNPFTSLVMKGSLSLQMGFIDRAMGFIYGAARGLLLMAGVFFLYAFLVDESQYAPLVKDAHFFYPLKEFVLFIKSLFTNG